MVNRLVRAGSGKYAMPVNGRVLLSETKPAGAGVLRFSVWPKHLTDSALALTEAVSFGLVGSVTAAGWFDGALTDLRPSATRPGRPVSIGPKARSH